MIVSDFSKRFNPKIRDLYNDLGILFRYDKKISDQYSIDNDCISIVQNRFQLININRVIKNNCALIAASEKIKINIPLIAVKTLPTRILIKLITTVF